MLKSITIKNFKSYEAAELPLSTLTFLIGANASGKSNAIEAIRLLHLLSQGTRLDDIERSIAKESSDIRGQSKDLFRNCETRITLDIKGEDIPSDWNSLSISFERTGEQLEIVDEEIKSTSARNTSKFPLYHASGSQNALTDEIVVQYNNFGKGGNKPSISCSNKSAVFYQLTSPAPFGKHIKSQKIIPQVTAAFRDSLRNMLFLDLRPALMRGYSYADMEDIHTNGDNISAVIHRICKKNNESEKLLDFIRFLPEQDIADIEFIITARNDVMLRLKETFGNEAQVMDAPLLSDGTLRVMGIAAALLTAKKNSLVVIEEIDNGVHPSRAEGLVQQIKKVASERELQVLVTTHNPALLDAIPNESLADVLCCFRDTDNGSSQIKRLGDMSQYPELVAQAPMGQLVTQRTLDRFLKDKRTDEDRIHSGQQWLRMMNSTSQGGMS